MTASRTIRATSSGYASPNQTSARRTSAQAQRTGSTRADLSQMIPRITPVDNQVETEERTARQAEAAYPTEVAPGLAPTRRRARQMPQSIASASQQQAPAAIDGAPVGDSAQGGLPEEPSPDAQVREAAPANRRRSAKSSAGGRRNDRENDGRQEYVSTSVGELRRKERRERAKAKSRRYAIAVVVAVVTVIALIVGAVVLYNSPAFSIENVEVKGVEHLTSDEMAQLANVPADTTLLRVDTATIEKRIKQNAWVSDVKVNRLFPSTLQIEVTERPVAAIVEVPTSAGSAVKQWAIAQDHIWLMPIPEAGSDAAKTTSSKIYEDAASALHITDVPYGTKAEIGQVCTDSNVNNSLDIVAGLTTELSSHIVKVSAAGTAETTLMLDNGVEVAFGKAEDIRDKERVILKILEENEDNVSYINVRMVETPTWRAV